VEYNDVLNFIKELKQNKVEYYKDDKIELRLDLSATEPIDFAESSDGENLTAEQRLKNDLVYSAGLKLKVKKDAE